jgi:hypothetical protein
MIYPKLSEDLALSPLKSEWYFSVWLMILSIDYISMATFPVVEVVLQSAFSVDLEAIFFSASVTDTGLLLNGIALVACATGNDEPTITMIQPLDSAFSPDNIDQLLHETGFVSGRGRFSAWLVTIDSSFGLASVS